MDFDLSITNGIVSYITYNNQNYFIFSKCFPTSGCMHIYAACNTFINFVLQVMMTCDVSLVVKGLESILKTIFPGNGMLNLRLIADMSSKRDPRISRQSI